jgi:hypothetical protein
MVDVKNERAGRSTKLVEYYLMPGSCLELTKSPIVESMRLRCLIISSCQNY